MDARTAQFLCSSVSLLQVCTPLHWWLSSFFVHFIFANALSLLGKANTGNDNLAVYFNLLADARLTICGLKKK